MVENLRDLDRERAQRAYERIARQVEREDALINQRLTRMLQFEGFLFTAIGLINTQARPGLFSSILQFFLPLAGFAAVAASYFGVHAAHLSLDDLKGAFNSLRAEERYVQPFGKVTRRDASLYLSFVIGLIWFVIFGAGCARLRWPGLAW